ncbi:transcriptional regulator with XRE-family HTH domain [Kineothrix alysoides]|uniref:Transcriptional regulator with XRE-family HTH domain n=1 Tax=Kineothrix alysoides TaxID=1469948 RepID=A0A4R1QWM8_9FIRM|nr:helix-turn-helix transcriptional regulator [Kineothrix alysoides]TCL55594.1 transcriptional regulator with XRE-family HTH domain [Kineothrix alysoides]
MNVAERIKQLRTDKKLTVNKLANLAGLSQGFVRQIELGEKNPTVESLSLICDALNISLSDFFQEEPNFTHSKNELQNELVQNITNLTNKQLSALIEITKSMNN